MGFHLVQEVIEHAPADLTPSERLVLTVLAHDANDRTRRCWPNRPTLLRWTGLGEHGLRKVFARLAERGIELRVPLGQDGRGRPYFTHRGSRALTYEIPRFMASAEGETTGSPSEEEGDHAGAPSETRGSPSERERCDDSLTPPVNQSGVQSDARDPEREQIAETLCREHAWPLDHCRHVVDDVLTRARRRIVSPPAYVLGAVHRDTARFAPNPSPARSVNGRRKCSRGYLVGSDGSCCDVHERERDRDRDAVLGGATPLAPSQGRSA
jgi:hypothetical protein